MNPLLLNGVGSPQSVLRSSSDQQHAIGTKGVIGESVFYYTKASGTAMTIAELQVQAAVVTNHHELAIAAGGGVAGNKKLTSITSGATLAAENLYAEGYVTVTDNTGAGQMFKIKEHASWASAATTVAVTLYDEIVTSLDATSTVSFIKNKYDSPQQSNTTVAEVPVGVPRATIAADEYGWLQTAGPCPCLFDEAVAIGQAVTVGTGTAGALEEDDTATTVSQEFIVGYTLMAGVDTERQPVFLQIQF